MLFKIFWDFVEKMVVTSDVIEDTIRFFSMQVYTKKPSPEFDMETLKMANFVKHFVCSQIFFSNFDS